MMTWRTRILAAAMWVVVPACLLAEGDPAPAPQLQPSEQGEAPVLFPDRSFGSTEEIDFLVRGQSRGVRREAVVRFGWWGIDADGAVNKTGEWQSLESSSFWDVDQLSSDGTSTLDYTLTGNDNETTDVDAYYFGPGLFGKGLTVDVDFDRYLHRLDNDPLVGTAPPSDRVVIDEPNVGEDYAIRVQQVKADFKGRVNDNIKWRLNLWGMRKHGERQVNSTAHCYDPGGGATEECHVRSQRQRIDWTTLEIEPVIEAKWGAITAEYSRTMRAFDQDDELALRPFDHFGFNGDYAYGIVPDNFTQIDRLKFGVDVTPTTDFYANVWHGDTENKFRDIHRRFYGLDMRVTNRSIQGVNLVGYVKTFTQTDQNLPAAFLPPGTAPPAPIYGEPISATMAIGGMDDNDIRFPIDRTRTNIGVKARWRPFPKYAFSQGLSVNGGYEYREIERTNVGYLINGDPATVWTQPDTFTHRVHMGTSRRWSACFDTFVRYTMDYTRAPLYGVREADENLAIGDPSSVTNTSLPEHSDLVEVGGTWTPSYQFLLSATLGLNTLHHNSIDARFDETSYPLTLSGWWAPVDRWSFSAGYAYFTNFIDQDISVGFRQPGFPPGEAVTSPWSYKGRTQVFNAGARYQWSEPLSLSGGAEWVRGSNVFVPTSPPGTDFSSLTFLSDVVIETTRVWFGADYELWDHVNCYARYSFFDYEDEATDRNSGLAHMVLGGVSATY